MSYLKLILKNPFRNKTRSSFAIIGITLGIMVIVALGMVTGGLETSTQSTLKSGAAEITVVQTGSSVGSGSINETRVNDVQSLSGVNEVAGTLSAINRSTTSASSSNNILSLQDAGNGGFTVTGIDSDKLSLVGVDTVDGNLFSNGSNEIIIGKTAANNLNKTVGDNIYLFGEDFKITGIFETGNYITDAGAFMSLNTLQNLTNNNNKVSSILVKINSNANVTEVSNIIDNSYPNELSTVTSTTQSNIANQALSTIDMANWLFSIIAIIIGGLGIINTMVMSVNERTREIGVLKAVGWKERRILGMILGESLVLTLIAAVLGTIVAIVGVTVLLSFTSIGGLIKPYYSLDIIVRALVVAFTVGIIGGLYPAYRASKLSPTEALGYE